ncbi:MAG: NAD(P)-dependent oxidoreductase [Ignavibacteriae bacterium HGW-Ignavibacteriae-2]|jgi:NADP-dependent 3-hydroxy acid dehydrogenase YdfG|nr:MAG: NAD(P)-dependent oxidoreductase [Ignavibacteriae bacterium HGW-Ignavibacteriae-2]
MAKLENKIVFITGASEGIGKACAYAFAAEGANLILSARRKNLLDDIGENIEEKFGVKVLTLKLDVRNGDEVKASISNLPEQWAAVDILINNAGLAKGFEKMFKDDPENWDAMIDTNLKGLLYVTRQIVPGMVKRNSGHVISLGSTAGHMAYGNGSVYCATKFGVRAISDSLRIDLIDTDIRVSTVDPGMVETDFSNIRFFGDKERASKVYEGITPLSAEDIADTILYCATRPPHVSINEVIMTPVAQANSFVAFRK